MADQHHESGPHNPQVISHHEAEHNEEFHNTPKGLTHGFKSEAEKHHEAKNTHLHPGPEGHKPTAHVNTIHHGKGPEPLVEIGKDTGVFAKPKH